MNCESANLPFGDDNPKSDILQFKIIRFCCGRDKRNFVEDNRMIAHTKAATKRLSYI